MSSFDKFIEDLEKREAEKRAKLEQMRAAEEQHSIRDRVKLYAEKWQNSIRYSWRQK